jgi:hypothetical protein
MSDKTNGNNIVPSGKSGLVPSGHGGNKLIRKAASDALALMNSAMNLPKTILHWVGTREFHDEDFRQLQVWTSEIEMEGQVSEFMAGQNLNHYLP